MITASWNCQGLGIDLTVRRLTEIRQMYLPDMLCLLETKQKDDKIRDICADLGYDRSVSIPPMGLSGGVAVLWNSNISVSVISLCSNLVDCHVESNGIRFYLSFVYGFPEPSNRHYLWEKLERTSTTRQAPWLIIGDLNEIRGNEEKRGGPQRPESSIADFRKMITTCDFFFLNEC